MPRETMYERKHAVDNFLKKLDLDRKFNDSGEREKAIEFLARHKMGEKEEDNETERQILGSAPFNYAGPVKSYYENKPLKEAKQELQQHRALYNTKRCHETKKDGDFFGNSFCSYIEWWCKQEQRCAYCKVPEKTSQDAFKFAENQEKDFPLLKTKKRAWKNGTLQIEKKDPEKGYCADNCVLACVLCNNAKSDLIPSDTFAELFAPAVRKYWEHIKCAMEGNKN